MTSPRARVARSTDAVSVASDLDLTGTGERPVPVRVLWLVLVLAVAGNAVASFAGAITVVHVGFGAISATCVAALVGRHLRSFRPGTPSSS